MRILSSPRMRRRLAWSLAAVGLAGGAAAFVVLMPWTSGSRKETLSPGSPNPVTPKPRRVTAPDRRAIDATLDTFVAHAVRRRDAGVAYKLVTPEFRAGTSRAEWSRQVPVYPYPAAGRTFHGWTIAYSNTDEVGIRLLLRPRHGARVGPISFDVTLKKLHGAWLVDSFLPGATFAPLDTPAKVRATPDFTPQTQDEGGSSGESRVGGVYTVIPFAILGALLIGLALWALARWYRSRRLMHAYQRPLTIRADDARARPAHRP